MSINNQQRRESAFDLPMKAKQWAADYRMDGDPQSVQDFAHEIDTIMMPALTRMHQDGLITDYEYSSLGGRIWSIWADYFNEVMLPPKEDRWTTAKRWIHRVLWGAE
jgi:hypothetical protein